ncbi:MAG: transcription antitermination factor NusB [Candidatus Levyibacteriota bacterium]
MKTSLDPRHQKRQHIVQLLFAQTFQTDKFDPLIKPILEHIADIDAWITKIAPEFPIDKINKVDLSILRLTVYELTIEKEAPEKVYIDEAIELAKEFGGENSPAFINGALGKLIKELGTRDQ